MLIYFVLIEPKFENKLLKWISTSLVFLLKQQSFHAQRRGIIHNLWLDKIYRDRLDDVCCFTNCSYLIYKCNNYKGHWSFDSS